MTTIAEQFKEQGRQKGLAQGINQGSLLGRRAMLVKQLGLRFGTLDEATLAQVERGTEEELDRWAERVLTAASLGEVFG